jgi:hypothetical protein
MVLRSRVGNGSPSFEVEHVGQSTLLIAAAACEPRPAEASCVKLSVEGLRELVSLTESLDAHANQSGRPVGHASAGPAPAHCRRGRRSSGGDVS